MQLRIPRVPGDPQASHTCVRLSALESGTDAEMEWVSCLRRAEAAFIRSCQPGRREVVSVFRLHMSQSTEGSNASLALVDIAPVLVLDPENAVLDGKPVFVWCSIERSFEWSDSERKAWIVLCRVGVIVSWKDQALQELLEGVVAVDILRESFPVI
jgi:hypothetical protein